MENTDLFFRKINSYTKLSKESETAWLAILNEKIYNKGEYFVGVGQVPKKLAFVCNGLFSQYYISGNGDTVIKEPYEISLRNDSAKVRYNDFLTNYPGLVKRLKKHHIASFLGITPTQLSRIFFANK